MTNIKNTILESIYSVFILLMIIWIDSRRTCQGARQAEILQNPQSLNGGAGNHVTKESHIELNWVDSAF